MTPDLPQAVAERFPLEPVASPIWTRIKSRLAVIDHRGAQPDPVQSAGGAVGSSTLGSIDRLATLRPGR